MTPINIGVRICNAPSDALGPCPLSRRRERGWGEGGDKPIQCRVFCSLNSISNRSPNAR
jgi:hypothetical protein